MPSEKTHYQSPLEARYASPEMSEIWSDHRKFSTWRKLWLALAEAQQQLGLNISDAQLAELRDHQEDLDYKKAAEYEAKLRHDVMAHVHTLGEVAPLARPIIHLGATSQFVNCNTELIQLRDALNLISIKTARVIDALAKFAEKHKSLPTLGFTHFQPAQPTTVGKRAAMWAYDLALALEDLENKQDTLRFRGAKGTTGTQASFLDLFDGDESKVEQLDVLITEKMGWPPDRRFIITGQTYPRIVDAQVLGSLASTAAVCHKLATDIRLLAHRKELEEPFEKDQIGSSAMAYKRNPMRCERACGMSRFVINLAANPLQTAATQWLERTLDDSANRRLTLPEAFLSLDGALDILHNVTEGLIVYEHTIRANLMAELPFMATENLMMEAVRRGADRQEVHEIIRRCSLSASRKIKEEGKPNDLLAQLQEEQVFMGVDFDAILDPALYVGCAPSQVARFVSEVVTPIRQRYLDHLHASQVLRV